MDSSPSASHSTPDHDDNSQSPVPGGTIPIARIPIFAFAGIEPHPQVPVNEPDKSTEDKDRQQKTHSDTDSN